MKQPQEGLLERFQEQVYAILRSKNDFQMLSIGTEKRSDFGSFCERLVRESIGQGLWITPPLPNKLIENVPGPVYEQVDFSIRVIENILTNATGCSAIDIAEGVTTLLHLKETYCCGRLWVMRCRTKEPWLYEDDDYKNIITLHFMTTCSF
ncbi:MAG: hypothetical protein LBB11_03465 [Puniceicoccales bacterium]|jgi:hypothetical protein|nr:hypothetical protein [Puniceicoccales bacterium]